MRPGRCQSGEHHGFFGVDLYDREDERLGIRIVGDQDGGTFVNVNIPDSDNLAIQVDGEGCAVFDVQLVQQPRSTNRIWHMAGYLRLDCPVEGGRVHGEVEFDDCG